MCRFKTLIIFVTVFVVLEDKAGAQGESSTRYKNVIVMVGDGMGLAQVSAARLHKGRLWIEDSDDYGFSFTHSLDNFVTDSAASATALASGFLVPNRHVATHSDGEPIPTILELARTMGKRTGLVATSRVTHATPAAFATHVNDRGEEYVIAEQLSHSEVDVLLGGGWDKFLPRKQRVVSSDASAKLHGTRGDGRDLVEEMMEKGYRFVRTAAELESVKSPGRTLGLFYPESMPRVTRGRSPSLAAMTRYALRELAESPDGFFLMVEGSQIDWGGHSNDLEYVIDETADFDDAIGEVYRFLKENGLDDDTLVVITADHETGGLSLNQHPQFPLSYKPKWTTEGHSGIAVPVFSFGAGSRDFRGIQTHSEIGRKLIEGMLGRELAWEYPESSRSF